MSAEEPSTSLAIADAMAEVARTMNAYRTADEVLESVVHIATDTIPGIGHASVTVSRKDGGCETKVATDELPRRADHFQYELGEGPCLEALATHKRVEVQALPRSRKAIGQAIGIVQERYGMDEERAFQFLVRVSQTGNIKLREVADELVRQGNRRGAG